MLDVSARVLPSPGLVVQSTWDDRANLWPAVETTTKEAVFGIGVAIVLAVVPRDRDRLVTLASRAESTR